MSEENSAILTEAEISASKSNLARGLPADTVFSVHDHGIACLKVIEQLRADLCACANNKTDKAKAKVKAKVPAKKTNNKKGEK